MNIVLGVTGGIAAYKTPELVRRLRDAGADVRVIVTPNATLRLRGVSIIEPGSGPLAEGEEGPGRLADIPVVVERVLQLFRPKDLQGRSVLVTAGPTREPIDPVRFLSNRSSGKMGYAMA